MMSSLSSSTPLPSAGRRGRGALLAQRLGLNIQVKLALAFGTVLALTLVAGTVGYLSFQDIGGGPRRLVDAHLPAGTAAPQVGPASGQIAEAAPSLMSAANDAARRAEFDALTQKQQSVTELIKTLRDRGGVDPAALQAV